MQSPNWSKNLSHLLWRFISTSRCYISMLYNCSNPNEWFSFWMSYILVPCVSVASRLYRTSDMLSLSIRSVAVFLLCFASFIIGISCLVFFLRKLFWYSIVCPCLTALFSIILYIVVGGLTLHIHFTLSVGPFYMLITMIQTILD